MCEQKSVGDDFKNLKYFDNLTPYQIKISTRKCQCELWKKY